MDAFEALPERREAGPAVLVVQEAFGVNDHIREVCRRLAREGYTALAPEFYHRSGRGITLGYDNLQGAMGYLGQLTNETLEMDIRAGLEHLRGRTDVDPARVGVVGFCMGGFGAFLAACRTDVATAVCFYGGGIARGRPGSGRTPLLDEAKRITTPVLCLFGEKDTAIPLEDVEAIRRRLEELGETHEVLVYPGAGHGFFCEERSSYDESAAKDAWRRTKEWLGQSLRA